MTTEPAATRGAAASVVLRRPARGRRALTVLVVVVLGLFASTPARAQDTLDADALGLEVTAGIGGWTVRDAWTPVEVRLQPEQPFGGRILLAATGDGGNQVISRSVEVGARVTKVFRLLAPPARALQVQVVADGADEGVTVRPDEDRVTGFLVGLLGTVDPRDVPGVTSPTTDMQATVVPVADEVLGLGPRGLASVSTLVVDHGELLALSDEDRDTIARAVAGGAHLVVTGTTGTDLGLPWQTAVDVADGAFTLAPRAWGADTAALAEAASAGGPSHDLAAIAAGRGRVVTATWRPAQYRQASAVWEQVLQPTAAARPSPNRQGAVTQDVEQVFRATAGQPLALGWLGAFLVAYLVVVGPLMALVFRRRRRPELAWVAVPVVTALFATAAFFGASGARPRVGVTGHVATWVDGVGTTLAVAGVRAPQPGQHTIALPDGPWDVVGSGWNTSAQVTDTGDEGSTSVDLELPGFSFGAVLGYRATTAAAPLEVEVALFESEAHVEVTNVGSRDLDDVRIRLATEETQLAVRLPAGETVVETVAVDPQLPRQGNPFGDRFDAMPMGARDDADPAALARLVRWTQLDGAPGLVWVTATAPDDLGLPRPSVDGSRPTGRGTLVAVAARASTTDDMTTPFEVQRDALLTTDQAFQEMPLTVSGSGPLAMRFHLPREGTVTGVHLLVDRTAGGGVRGGGGARPVPMPPERIERCGLLETRDAETGDLVSSEDFCGPRPPCPAGATSCGVSESGDGPIEAEVCFRDGRCQEMTWHVDGGAVPDDLRELQEELERQQLAGGAGMQVWDHRARRWEEATAVTQAPGEVRRWLGPLGDVWVRATGELTPLDVAPQGVAADLGGTT